MTTGRIYISADHGTAYVVDGDAPPAWANVGTGGNSDCPPTSAPKTEWVDYATRIGIEGAASMTKADIISAATELAEQE